MARQFYAVNAWLSILCMGGGGGKHFNVEDVYYRAMFMFAAVMISIVKKEKEKKKGYTSCCFPSVYFFLTLQHNEKERTFKYFETK